MSEAGRLLRALEGIPWPVGIKEALTSMVVDRTVATTASPVLPRRSKMQDYRAFAEYLTEDMWAALIQERATAQARMDVLLAHGEVAAAVPQRGVASAVGGGVPRCQRGPR